MIYQRLLAGQRFVGWPAVGFWPLHQELDVLFPVHRYVFYALQSTFVMTVVMGGDMERYESYELF